MSNNVAKLAEHRESRERLDYLCQSYPGPFAEAVRGDSEQVETCLLGRRYELTDADLAWRSPGVQPPASGGDAAVAPDAQPHEVMTAFYGALKAGDLARWRELFASWDAERVVDGVTFREEGLPSEARISSEWERARGLILGPVYDVRVVAVDEVDSLTVGGELEGVPRVEQVKVEVEHVGKFDGEYRAFIGHVFSRTWELQRLNAGPWRIRSYPNKGWF